MNNICRILTKINFVLLIVFSAFAVETARAKTISNNTTIISDSNMNYFMNLYENSDKSNYLIASDTYTSGYNTYTDNYLCLTNEKIEKTDSFNAKAKCDVLYRYYRDGTYKMEKVNDKELILNNSNYYTTTQENKYYRYSLSLLLLLLLFLNFISFYYMFNHIIR